MTTKKKNKVEPAKPTKGEVVVTWTRITERKTSKGEIRVRQETFTEAELLELIGDAIRDAVQQEGRAAK